jgi:hypothetical protein
VKRGISSARSASCGVEVWGWGHGKRQTPWKTVCEAGRPPRLLLSSFFQSSLPPPSRTVHPPPLTMNFVLKGSTGQSTSSGCGSTLRVGRQGRKAGSTVRCGVVWGCLAWQPGQQLHNKGCPLIPPSHIHTHPFCRESFQVVRSSARDRSSPRPRVPGSDMSEAMASSLMRARLWKWGPSRLRGGGGAGCGVGRRGVVWCVSTGVEGRCSGCGRRSLTPRSVCA